MRLMEFGIAHRNEPSGTLSGCMRLRQFVQDDAHIFCREKDLIGEIGDRLEPHRGLRSPFTPTATEYIESTYSSLHLG